jgi:hypothetical protein
MMAFIELIIFSATEKFNENLCIRYLAKGNQVDTFMFQPEEYVKTHYCMSYK